MKKTILLIVGTLFFASCNINPSVMFRVPSSYEYDVDQTIGNVEYRVSPNDIVSMSVYTNDGFKLIDLTASAESVMSRGGAGMNNMSFQYLVEPDGNMKLPIIGKLKLAGLTIREAEKFLETQYANFYNKPFVVIRIVNRRVTVFPGTGGSGRMVNLDNESTTVIEALALAGGITNTGKARKIKLIRGDLRNPRVILIDLSTIEGLKQGNLLLQANDIIYVEPVPRISQEVLTQIAPIVGILTSFALIYNIATGL
jgi:polysaccharide export outer membrane protein